MSSDNRYDILKKLLVAVFTDAGISFDDDGISKENPYINREPFKSTRSIATFKAQYSQLFEYALLDDSAEFRNSKVSLNSEELIQNAQKYLCDSGVDLSEWYGLTIEKEYWRRLLCEAVVSHILPAIFFIESRVRDGADGDVKKHFRSAIDQIQTMFDREFMYCCRNLSVIELTGPDAEGEPDYILPISSELIDYPVLIPWKQITMKFDLDSTYFPSIGKITNIHLTAAEDPMLNGFYKVPDDQQLMTISPARSEIRTHYFPVSYIGFDSRIAGKPDVMYRVYLHKDEEQLREEYHNSAELKSRITEKALRDISDFIKEKEKDYYISIAEQIRYILKSVYEVDPHIFEDRTPDMELCKDALECFGCDSEMIAEKLTRLYGEDKAKKIITGQIFDVCFVLASRLSEHGQRLAGKFRKYMPDEKYNNYLNAIRKILDNCQESSSESNCFEPLNTASDRFYAYLSTYEEL